MPALDVFQRYLYEHPDVGYYAAIPSFLGPSQRQFFFNRFPSVYREFQAQMGQEIGERIAAERGGHTPKRMTSFGAFLQDYPWEEKYMEAAGGQPYRTAPQTRWLF